jgi:hypothetical protein
MKAIQKALATALLIGSAANASIITYDATLTGAAEVPPTGSPGTGFAIVTINTITQMMNVNVVFSGLLGPTTASHIHCCTMVPGAGTAGVATTTPSFTGFPLGVTSGSFNNTFDLTLASSYNPAFVTAEGGTVASAEVALLAGMAADETYLNIHTSVDPGGEISGFLVATPEPATWLLAGIALIATIIRRGSFSRT